MEKLEGKILNEFPLVESMVRIGDLVNFEGPLLTLFEDCRNGNLYVFDWVDRDSDKNRWVVYHVTPIFLYEFIAGKISHRELFLSAVSGFYSLEINRKLQFENFRRLQLQDLPDDYLPKSEAFFEANDCPHLLRIEAKVKDIISRQNFIIRPKHQEADLHNVPPKHWHYSKKESSNLNSHFEKLKQAQASQSTFINSILPQFYSKANRYA